MASVLTIDGAAVDRPASRVVLNALNLSLDGFDTLEFTELAVRPPGAFTARKKCELAVDGVTVFKGEVVQADYAGIGSGPIDVGYRAFGLEWLANRVQVTAADGSGRLVYNLGRDDPGYLPANSGLSVGAILKKLFDLHADALAAVGVVGYTAADLTPLTVTPPEPVYLSGGLWNCVKQLLYQWHNKYGCWIDPSTGKVVVADMLTLPAVTLTLDSDPIVVGRISRDDSECFTRVVCRGAADVQAAFLTFVADSTLAKGWTPTQEADWSYDDFLMPKDAADLGAVTAMSSTTLTVKSDSATAAWVADYWGPLNAEVVAYDPAATGITFSESRRITSNTALSAGGSSILTVDAPFNNSGYTRYSIRGLYAESSLVWRTFTTPVTYVAQHLVQSFSHAFPWSPVDGVVTMTTSPQANVCWSDGCAGPNLEWPVTFTIVPYDGTTDGHFVFDEPVLKPFGTMAKLREGGAAVDGIPCEIKMLVPYSVGAITATAPASGYEGTAYAVDGLENVLYRDFPGWTDYKDQASYQTLAQETLDTVKNTVVEGSLSYAGKLSSVLTKGKALNLAAVGYSTGFEAINAPIRSVTLDFDPTGSGGAGGKWTTSLGFSNRLKPFAGDRVYTHPAYGSTAALRGVALPPPPPASIDDGGGGFGPGAGYGGGSAGGFGGVDLADLGFGTGDPGRYTPRSKRKRPRPLAGPPRPPRPPASAEDKLIDALNAQGEKNEADMWRNANDADDRENRRRVAKRKERRKLSPEDARVDSMLADLMKKDGGPA